MTARHLLHDEAAPEVELNSRHGRHRLRLGFIRSRLSAADVAVALLQEPITPQLSLVPSSDGVAWSQQVYFLGFPYGMATQMRDDESDRVPFVKQAIVSASVRHGGRHLWFLDGHGNPGFSGGPVVASKDNFETMQVIAVVAGNRAAERPVLVADKPLEEMVVRENTGIVVATDISHAVELMKVA